jgi:hypothetical protein
MYLDISMEFGSLDRVIIISRLFFSPQHQLEISQSVELSGTKF